MPGVLIENIGKSLAVTGEASGDIGLDPGEATGEGDGDRDLCV